MDTEKLTRWVSWGFSWLAAILFALAIVEWIFSAVKLMQPRTYPPARLIETGALFLVPVIAILLAQIRDAGERRRN